MEWMFDQSDTRTRARSLRRSRRGGEHVSNGRACSAAAVAAAASCCCCSHPCPSSPHASEQQSKRSSCFPTPQAHARAEAPCRPCDPNEQQRSNRLPFAKTKTTTDRSPVKIRARRERRTGQDAYQGGGQVHPRPPYCTCAKRHDAAGRGGGRRARGRRCALRRGSGSGAADDDNVGPAAAARPAAAAAATATAQGVQRRPQGQVAGDV